MTWSERVAPGVAIMRERAAMMRQLGGTGVEPETVANLIERMAEELDNARQTIMAFSIFGIVLAVSMFAYAWRVG